MKTINVPALEFYEFASPVELADDSRAFIKNANIKFNRDNVGYQFGKIFYYQPLFDWFEQCIQSVETKFKLTKDEPWGFSISDAWVNKQNLGDSVRQHLHCLSVLSGIYYLDNSKTTTKFRIPNYSFHNDNYLLNILERSSRTQEILPEKGKLIIFPSHLLHQVDIHRERSIRYTISFNLFLNGKFDYVTGALNLKVNDVKSQYYEWISNQS